MKARVNTTKKTETPRNNARERWNDKGEINKGQTTGNGVGASSLDWFELEFFSKSSVTLWTCIWTQTGCSAGCDLWSIFFNLFFRNALSRAHRGVLVPGHFFVASSQSFIAICHCRRFLASFFKQFFLRKSMERKLRCQLFTATNCNTLARHALKLICHTTFDSVLFKSLRGSVVLLWRHVAEVTWPNRDFQLQSTQLLEASCLFSFKSILLRTSGKCQCIKRTVCMLNFIYIGQCKWYLRLKISVQGP